MARYEVEKILNCIKKFVFFIISKSFVELTQQKTGLHKYLQNNFLKTGVSVRNLRKRIQQKDFFVSRKFCF